MRPRHQGQAGRRRHAHRRPRRRRAERAHLRPALARVSLEETRPAPSCSPHAIFHRAREVVAPGAADPYAALRADGGLRSILEVQPSIRRTSPTPPSSTPDGIAVAHSDRVARRAAAAPRPATSSELLTARAARAARARIYSREAADARGAAAAAARRRGSSASIRIGVSTLLIRRDARPTRCRRSSPALIALLVAIVAAACLAQCAAAADSRHPQRPDAPRPRRVRRRLDLPQQDEFGDLGGFFNTVSAQLSADRSQLAGPEGEPRVGGRAARGRRRLFNPTGELLFANPAMRTTLPAERGRPTPLDDLLGAGHPLPRSWSQRGARRPTVDGPSRPAFRCSGSRRTARPQVSGC